MNEAEPSEAPPRSPGGAGGLLLPRVFGALMLRARIYEEVARDTRAGFQSGLLIVIVGVLEASVHSAIHHHSDVDLVLMVGGVTAALIGWFLWTAIVWVVGARAFGHEVDFPVVLRAVAFAHSPALFYGFGVVPGITEWSGLLYVLTLLWFVGALYAAIRGAFGLEGKRAVQILAAAVLIQLLLREILPYAFRLVPGLGN